LDNIGMEQERVALSQKESKRIKVMELLVNGRMTNQEAAESLGLCYEVPCHRRTFEFD